MRIRPLILALGVALAVLAFSTAIFGRLTELYRRDAEQAARLRALNVSGMKPASSGEPGTADPSRGWNSLTTSAAPASPARTARWNDLAAFFSCSRLALPGRPRGGTKASFRSRPESAISGRKGDTDQSTTSVQVGFALSADRWRPVRQPIITPPARFANRKRCAPDARLCVRSKTSSA